MLAFVAGASDDTEQLTDNLGDENLARVRHWADAMLQRAMTSRKPDRPVELAPEEIQIRRFAAQPTL